MAVWSLFHLGEGEHDGVRLMRADTHRLMMTRAFNDRPGGADLAHGLMARPYRGVDTFGHGGATALFLAAKYGHDEMVCPLLRQGAALNTPNEEGLTPLRITSRVADRLTTCHAPSRASSGGRRRPCAFCQSIIGPHHNLSPP